MIRSRVVKSDVGSMTFNHSPILEIQERTSENDVLGVSAFNKNSTGWLSKGGSDPVRSRRQLDIQFIHVANFDQIRRNNQPV